MDEEIRKTGTEINEAAPEDAGGIENTPQLSDAELSNVSGGGSSELLYKEFCFICDRRGNCGEFGTRFTELERWVRANGTPSKCPFYND